VKIYRRRAAGKRADGFLADFFTKTKSPILAREILKKQKLYLINLRTD
jgi:hypothetical protein